MRGGRAYWVVVGPPARVLGRARPQPPENGPYWQVC